MGIFDYSNSILTTGKNLMRNSENDDLAEKEYNPYITNSALSRYPDTILIANILNGMHSIPKRAQYEFGLYATRQQKRRFVKWDKAKKDDSVEIICAYYKCNYARGKEILELLTNEQIQTLLTEMETGGNKK